jgi:DNA-directed RNA polymerase specialized sigma24 family protein
MESQQEHPIVFAARFARCSAMLYFLAGRILGGSERLEDVVQSCWVTASRNPPRFEYEGAFRSWLVRVLMDEALAILHRNQETLMADSLPQTGTPRLPFRSAFEIVLE